VFTAQVFRARAETGTYPDQNAKYVDTYVLVTEAFTAQTE